MIYFIDKRFALVYIAWLERARGEHIGRHSGEPGVLGDQKLYKCIKLICIMAEGRILCIVRLDGDAY